MVKFGGICFNVGCILFKVLIYVVEEFYKFNNVSVLLEIGIIVGYLVFDMF